MFLAILKVGSAGNLVCHSAVGGSAANLVSELSAGTTKLSWLDMEWCSILQRTQLHMNLLEPFIAFRRVLLQVLSSRDCVLQHLLQSATTLRKGCRFSQAASALHEFELFSVETKGQSSSLYWLGREKFSDVVNWIKANASKGENSVVDAGATFSGKKLLPEVVNKENKPFGEKTRFTTDTNATNFASSWTLGLFSSSQSIFGYGATKPYCRCSA